MLDRCSTLQDLIELLHSADLPANRSRDLISAVSRVAEMLGCAPRSVPTNPLELRRLLRTIRPAAHRISPKTFSNIRSLLASALALAGQIDPRLRRTAQSHPAWRPLIKAIAGDKELRSGLAAFANWCASQDVTPQQVSDGTLQEFLTWLERRTLHPKPRELARRVPILWSRASARIAPWPKTELARLSFRLPSNRISWRDLPESFRQDVDAYVQKRREPDIFSGLPRMPRRPLADSTLRQHREHVRLAASILVLEGRVPAAEITSLRQLVEVEAFKSVLRHYHSKKPKGEPSAFANSLAITLIQVAQYHVGASEEHVNELKRLARMLPEVPNDLTPKNKLLLRQLEARETRARLLFLPERLLNDVKRDLKNDRFRFVDAQCAIAIDILLVVPLRPQNLSALHWKRHFQENDRNGGLLLHIPAAETKTKKEIIHDVPKDVADRIRWYRKHVLARVSGDCDGYLFVAQHGGRKDQKTLAGQLIAFVERNVGLRMTPHQFRHFAAVSYLEENPEDFETARGFLGHAWSKTTSRYAGSSTRRSGRAYAQFLFRSRSALRLQRPTRKPRTRKPRTRKPRTPRRRAGR